MEPTITDEELLSDLRSLHDELEKTPTWSDVDSHGEYSPITYLRRFGSFDGALSRIGLSSSKPKAGRKITDRELLDELHRLSEELGRTPSGKEMNQLGKYSKTAYVNHFGSWNEAVVEAGLEPVMELNITREDLLQEIQRLHDQLDIVPRAKDMQLHGRYDPETYRRIIGGWVISVREAGLTPRYQRDLTQEDILETLQDLRVELGHVPSMSEVTEHSDINSGIIPLRFDSFNTALKEAGLMVGE